MQLHFVKTGQGSPLLILHGLFGSGDNWRTHALALSERYTVYCIDQRDHGKSPHTDALSYPLMAADLHELISDEGLDKVSLLGHSMGGKTVMQYAFDHPDRVEKLIVADMAPQSYPPHHNDVLTALHAANPATAQTRQEVENVMIANGLESSVYQFLMKSLYRQTEGGFAWRFNLETITRDYAYILENIETYGQIFTQPTLFIRGERSHYVEDSALPAIRQLFPFMELVTIPNAGHWVHAEAPEPFLSAVQTFLAE